MSYIFLLHMERYFTFARRTVVSRSTTLIFLELRALISARVSINKSFRARGTCQSRYLVFKSFAKQASFLALQFATPSNENRGGIVKYRPLFRLFFLSSCIFSIFSFLKNDRQLPIDIRANYICNCLCMNGIFVLVEGC